MPILDLHDARHRDDDVEVRVTRQHLVGGRVHTGGVGGVDPHGMDTGMFRGDLRESNSALRLPPTMTVLPLACRRSRQRQADPAGRAGDEDPVAADLACWLRLSRSI